ncbi:hypothetical protein BH24CHL5_BH24CHL5_04850 [soil metagenome]
MSGFRTAVLESGRTVNSWGLGIGKLGNLPAPFDAVDGSRLIGPSGSHPLAAIGAEELVGRSTDAFEGSIQVSQPVRIGEALSGRLEVTARRDISARTATFRLVGVVLTEHQRSREERDSEGKVVRREEWVEVTGKLFEELPFTQPPLPTTMTAGQQVSVEFNLPAPRLGPPSGHLGSAAILWALDAKWDVSMRGDERVAALVPVAQNIDYLRSGAVRLEPGALYDAWQVGDASIAVKPLPPFAAGQEIEVTVNWPGAGAGRGARLELQADVQAPNGLKGLVLYSAAFAPSDFQQGLTVKLPIPADAPPTMSDKGVGVSYTIRALVDRKLRSDLAVERALALM